MGKVIKFQDFLEKRADRQLHEWIAEIDRQILEAFQVGPENFEDRGDDRGLAAASGWDKDDD